MSDRRLPALEPTPRTESRSERGHGSGFASAPQRIAGRYEILGLLGTGGMGSVYRVRDTELDEVVALKMLRRDVAESAGMLERFRQEVKLARRVTHRNVARTFDFGDHEGEKFLTMECVDGESLHSVLGRTGPMPVQQVIGIGCALCDGLGAAHAAGVVHRDLKPENVLLDRGGRVVITDFGIARASAGSGAGQTSGFVLGSPAYMSPEQLTGEPDIDARTDIYALGMILFECLTHRRAWPGAGAIAAAMARLTSPPPDPRALRPDVPLAVADVVLRCMAMKREDRYGSAAEAHRALLLARSRVSISPHAGAQAGPALFPVPSLAGGSAPTAVTSAPTAPQPIEGSVTRVAAASGAGKAPPRSTSPTLAAPTPTPTPRGASPAPRGASLTPTGSAPTPSPTPTGSAPTPSPAPRGSAATPAPAPRGSSPMLVPSSTPAPAPRGSSPMLVPSSTPAPAPRGSSPTLVPSFTPVPTPRSSPTTPRSSLTPALKTVAVLPFRNAGAPEDEYLADGFTEDLTDTLSMTAGLKVRPRAAVARVRLDGRDPRDVGRELDVQVVVEGSIRRRTGGGPAQDASRGLPAAPGSRPGSRSAPGGVRVTARVISVEDGFQLWAKRFDSSAEALLDVSDDAARAIAAALTVDVASRERDASGDPRAVDLYLRARHQLRRLWYGDAAPAVALFEEALAFSPNDPTLLSGYAVATARLLAARGDGRAQLAKAQQAAERAIALSPAHGEPWVALATVRFSACDPVGAVPALRRALSCAPSLGRAHELLGRILMEAGLVEEAIFRLETALSLDPSELLPRWELARGRALLGDWAAVSALLDLPTEDPSDRFHKAVMRARFGLWRSSPFSIDDLLLAAETVPIQYARVYRDVLATARLADEQRAFLRSKAEGSEPGSRLRPLFFQMYAEILAFVGDDEALFGALAAAVDAGLFDALWMQRCAVLERARSDARFAPLRARVEERASAIVDAFKA
ncbi:protein kinase domain-containing protein [Sorangium cellulosum]|uniref:protein kinase domain-containing protein n=1 Tax=Sorangium cellulosum TaxID=56 RepID=UPI0023DDAE3C|nr:protein kinase [Sorangium cellulosum]